MRPNWRTVVHVTSCGERSTDDPGKEREIGRGRRRSYPPAAVPPPENSSGGMSGLKVGARVPQRSA